MSKKYIGLGLVLVAVFVVCVFISHTNTTVSALYNPGPVIRSKPPSWRPPEKTPREKAILARQDSATIWSPLHIIDKRNTPFWDVRMHHNKIVRYDGTNSTVDVLLYPPIVLGSERTFATTDVTDMLKSDVESISNSVVSLGIDINRLGDRVDVLSNNIDVVRQQMEVVTNDIVVIGHEIDSLNDEIVGLSNATNTIIDTIVDLESNFNSFSNSVDVAIQSIEADQEELESQVSVLGGDILNISNMMYSARSELILKDIATNVWYTLSYSNGHLLVNGVIQTNAP